ncbi:MAG: flagellar basal body L-ring protein FlgH [Sedimentisphaerales bacterium]|nr:flagellar basal body L-ring protein FlgH [Sedimentisphaerales bacterium]
MNAKISRLILLMVFMLVSTECLQANSIWAKRDKNMKAIYADDVARQIGDILTVEITENSTVDNKAKRDLKKETDRSTTFNGEVGNFADIGEFGMSAGSGNELTSKADYKDERKYADNITVVVVDILPNGNLVVTGNRKRDIAGDIQTVEVSGIVRPSDISFDNTVQSEQVADFHLVTKNKGVSAPYTRPGWLGTLFDIIWPF